MEAGTLLSAASRALSAAFPEMTVYNDTPVQGAKLPYLYVRQAGIEQRPDGPGRYRRTYRLSVETRHAPGVRAAQALEVCERLLLCLRKLDADGGSVLAEGAACSLTGEGEALCAAEYPLRVAVAPAPEDEASLMGSLRLSAEPYGE